MPDLRRYRFDGAGGADKFVAGPAIPEFGQVAKVDCMMPIPKGMKFKVAFDMSKAAD
ncbi:hypothetical protein [Shewanella sp. KJ2020]|uniref:hypothetical protein n=1 Tax=Shewanella sp. KJ2020 TaxID=2919172 RepID=UPI0020A7AB89|nr:hypothetical protein [Shewanella sp. KJ2020]MCP3127936.1 hypothetical protein [Shewanella sp. KJ2020]